VLQLLEDKEKDKLIDRNYLMNKRKNARTRNRFVTHKHRLFLTGILIGFLGLTFMYFYSNYSNVYHVNVKNNVYLSRDDIVRLSGLTEYSKYLLVSSGRTEERIEAHPLVKNAEISKDDDNTITIDVEEKKAIAYLREGDQLVVWIEDDTRLPLDSSNMYLIQRLPLIEGFTAEQMTELLYGFSYVDEKLINEISEIHRYPFTYDENMMEVIMRDGNYVFVGNFGLKLLKNYHSVAASLESDENVCLYFDEVTSSGFKSACPWEKKEEPETTQETGEEGETAYYEEEE
jgi:cell division protein FtsQ